MLVAMSLLLLALFIGGINYICKKGLKLPADAPPQKKKKKKKQLKNKGVRSWSQTDKFQPHHRSRKRQVYVAPVLKRKWRTPRRSSH
jgi:hypothetical protein